ncbi:MAG: DUF1835 domain-containing protein [Cyclobacteriaceae bacterium]
MHSTFHILNGDALAERFPPELEGNLIVCRECLCEGPVGKESLNELYLERENYLSTTYPEIDHLHYSSDISSEFEKIRRIPNGSDIYLWFEQDVFCQVNLWFILYLLAQSDFVGSIQLVITNQKSPYAFSGYSEEELLDLYRDSIPISELLLWAQLWKSFQQKQVTILEDTGKKLNRTYPFLTVAIHALLDSIPSEDSLSRPSRVLQEIIASQEDENFQSIFQEFCTREAIYGYGDLQVKRLYKEAKEEGS